MMLILFRQSCPIQSSSTAFVKKKFAYIWIINEAKKLHQAQASIQGFKIESNFFKYPMYLNLDFTANDIRVRFDSDGKTITTKGPAREDLDVWACDCSFSVLDRFSLQPSVCVKSKCTQLLKRSCSYHLGYKEYIGINSFTNTILDNDDFDSHLYDGSLCIQVNLNFVNIRGCSHPAEVNDIPSTPLSHDNLFGNEQFSDVTIQVHKTKFNVHKVMLASASEVFQHQFENSKSNVLQIDDISPSTMSQLLTYIYTGNVPDIESNTLQLLMAADRYRIPSLVSKCIHELQLKFTSSNVAETLSCADMMHYSDTVKTACIDFIKHNSVSVFKSHSWKSLTESSVTLAFEVMQQTLNNTVTTPSLITEKMFL